MEWLARQGIQLALAPLVSLFVSFAFPASLVLAWFMYRYMRTNKDMPSVSLKKRPPPTPFVSMWFQGILVALVTVYIYAQCTLLRHLYYAEAGRLMGAKNSNNLCQANIDHPGRNSEFIGPGCNAARSALAVDPLDEAVRQWTELFFSLGLPSWFAEPDTDPNKRAPLNVTVPFGVGRLMLLILMVMFFQAWFAPAVTYVQSRINHMRAGAAVA